MYVKDAPGHLALALRSTSYIFLIFKVDSQWSPIQVSNSGFHEYEAARITNSNFMNYEDLIHDKFSEGNIRRVSLSKLSKALLIINIVERSPRYKRLLSSKFPKI
jgi:hypothetical protein